MINGPSLIGLLAVPLRLTLPCSLRQFLVVAGLTLGAPAGIVAQGRTTVDYGAVTNAYFAPMVTSGRVRAAAVIITDGSRPIFATTFGPVDTGSTLWRVASVTKVLTALAALRLVDEHRLSLDTDVNRHLHTLLCPRPTRRRLHSGRFWSTGRVSTTTSLVMGSGRGPRAPSWPS